MMVGKFKLTMQLKFKILEKHNTGKLCTRFATDVPNVRYGISNNFAVTLLQR